MMLGTAHATEGDIFVAVFSAVTAAFTIALPAWMRARRVDKKVEAQTQFNIAHANEIKDTLGEKNGHGNIVNMLTTSLENQTALLQWGMIHDSKDDKRFEDLGEKIGDFGTAIGDINSRLTALEEPREPDS